MVNVTLHISWMILEMTFVLIPLKSIHFLIKDIKMTYDRIAAIKRMISRQRPVK